MHATLARRHPDDTAPTRKTCYANCCTRIQQYQPVMIQAGIACKLVHMCLCLLFLTVFSATPAFTAALTLPTAKVSLYFSEGGGAKQAILAAIGTAKKSIRVHSFFLSDREIASALIVAHKRGVSVEAVLCRRGQTEAIDPQGIRLVRAGIPVFLNGRFRAEHNKVMIFDEHIVQTGSYNYRFDADCLDAENVIFVEAPELAALYMTDYNSRRAEATPYDLKGPFKIRNTSSPRKDGGGNPGYHATYTQLPVEVYFAPSGGAKASIIAHIRQAERSIIVHSYYLSDPEITQALLDAKRAGIMVEALLSAKAPEKDTSPFLAGRLVQANIPVRLDAEHRNAHNKVIIYDSRIVQTGSYNLKMHVDTINAENILYIHSEILAQQYKNYYAYHLSHSSKITR